MIKICVIRICVVPWWDLCDYNLRDKDLRDVTAEDRRWAVLYDWYIAICVESGRRRIPISDEARDLIGMMLQLDSLVRPNARQASVRLHDMCWQIQTSEILVRTVQRNVGPTSAL